MSHEEHLRIALEKKDVGNNYFKANDINQAMRAYHEAILYLRTMVPRPKKNGDGVSESAVARSASAVPPAILAEATTNLIAVYSNLAACHTKTERWNRVIDCCNKALDYDPDHVKSLYRKGLALNREGRVDQANKVLRRALELAPNDANIIKELHLCKQQEKEALERQKKELSGMFERGTVY
ncbi:hypothetical protein AMAG_15087 [Allomyces macrogynus ATCC 38327]|uniref:Uncharacterized protein n=1 Tax=Allomyces macrogynus (strain ATCC 38327) TaxID=578462 RepID=A0A0L0T5T5_ALLM3|nr:hypothetical protein AMAG_15087 [Allomyces macrogynus ATCC 38327]|eukprot:KNE70110.1 hypothetical protein AMAG_15087 [Allomyces macrogynus ATCC 38327]